MNNLHELARVLLHGTTFNCSDIERLNMENIVDIIHKHDYTLDTLKILDKQNVFNLLKIIIMSEYIDEEETKSIINLLQRLKIMFDF